jgi:ABC-type multidrug transport system fused ATPase/permease subunit
MVKTLKTIYALLSPADRRRGAVVLALMFANASFALLGVGAILPFLTLAMDPAAVTRSTVLNWAYVNSGIQTIPDFLMVLGGVILALIVIMNVIAALELWADMRFVYGFAQSLSLRLMEQYLSRPYEFFLTRNTSELSKNVLSEIQELIGGVLKPGTVLLSRGVLALSLTILLIVIQPVITLSAMAVLGAAYLVVYSLINQRLVRLGRKRVETNSARYKVNAEAFGGLKEVKTLGREEFFLRRYDTVSRQHADHVTRSKVYPRLPLFLVESIAFGGFMAALLVLLGTGYEMTQVVPVLGFFAVAATRLLPGFQEILGSLANFRFNEHLLQKLHHELVEARVEPIRTVAADSLGPMPFVHRVRLEHIGFRYEGGSRDVIRDLTLEIPKNTSVALVGTTGAGKTTLVDIVLGLLAPHRGRVVVDDTPLQADNVIAWRRKVGYVPQDVFLTDDTIRRNIAFGLDDDRIDQGAVESAASVAHIHDFIVKELPHGYETVIGERGVRLSGGQRQRLGIARALYHDPEFLVLDEATSDIDNITEEYITEAIQNLAGRKTLLIVAHRLGTVKRCDRICVLDGGSIVAAGTFGELSATNAGFKRMIQGLRLEPVDATG